MATRAVMVRPSIRSSAYLCEGRSGRGEALLQLDERRIRDVAEARVDPAHRGVLLVVRRAEEARALALQLGDGLELQRERETLAAVFAPCAREARVRDAR